MSGSDSGADDGKGGPTSLADVRKAVHGVVGSIIADFDAAKAHRAISVKALTQVKAGDGDASNQYRASWFVKNRLLGAVSKSVKALPAAHFPGIEGVFSESIAALYNDVRIPLWLCSLIATEMVRRLQLVGAVSQYKRYCHTHGILLSTVMEQARASAPQRSEATQFAIAITGKKARAAPETTSDSSTESIARGARPYARGGKTNFYADIANLIGSLLRARAAAGSRPSLPLAELRGELLARMPHLAGRRANTQSEHTQMKTFRTAIGRVVVRLPQLEARGLLTPETAAQSDSIAVTNDAVVDLSALVTNNASPAATTTYHSDPISDKCFRLLLHLLKANFRLKKPASDAPPGMEYRGHNICCVAYETDTGRLVAMDFNQCKADQNLCSHAEKRMMEALTHSLRPTVPKGTPPSLSKYTVISSLEPCHMCANFVARMGVSRIGYLMRDPMQKDALEAAARMLDLTLIRPSEVALSGTLEAAFADANANGSFPPEEITSWLGSDLFITLLNEMVPSYSLDATTAAFLAHIGSQYPGCVDLAALPPGAIKGFAATDDSSDRGPSPTDTVAHLPRSSTDILVDAMNADVEALSDSEDSHATEGDSSADQLQQHHDDPFAFV